MKYEDVLLEVFGRDAGIENMRHAISLIKTRTPDRKAILERELTDDQAAAIIEDLRQQKLSAGREFLFQINDSEYLRRFGVE